MNKNLQSCLRYQPYISDGAGPFNIPIRNLNFKED